MTCSDLFGIEQLALQNNQMSGPFPTDLINFGNLTTFSTAGNSLVGTIPDDVCTKSLADELFVTGDSTNCPNDFDASVGVYLEGCCDSILIDVDLYLTEFATAILGDSDCANLVGTESNVCSYMTNKANHDIFTNGYPVDFAGDVWSWLKVSIRLSQ